jgi:hypothetical protein
VQGAERFPRGLDLRALGELHFLELRLELPLELAGLVVDRLVEVDAVDDVEPPLQIQPQLHLLGEDLGEPGRELGEITRHRRHEVHRRQDDEHDEREGLPAQRTIHEDDPWD